MTTHLLAPLLRRALAAPDASFAELLSLRVPPRNLSHRELLGRALAVGAHLPACGGAPVAIVLEHGVNLYAAFTGAILAGGIPAILPPLTPKQDPELFRAGMAALFARLQPGAVILSARTAASVPPVACAAIDADALGADEIDTARLALPAGGDTVALLQHSSGTTGLRKGVALTHAQVLRQARDYAVAIGMTAGDTVASWLPLYHDMGLIAAFLIPTVAGCRIVAMDAMEWVVRPATLLDAIAEYRAQFAWLPNFAFHHILRADRADAGRDLSSLRALVNCSEPCRAATADAFAARYATSGLASSALQASYAMAESVFALTHTPPGAPARGGRQSHTRAFLSSGKPLPGVAISVRDENGAEVPAGAVGELWAHGPCLFAGYFRQPEATAARLVDGWLRTGDLGCIEDGELFVLGRRDDVVIVNGRNLLAHELEEAASAIPGIAPGRVIVFGTFDAAVGSQRLVIAAEPNGDDEAHVETLRRAVFNACGVTPSEVRLVPRGFLVKSTSGKLARGATIAKLREAAGF